MYLQAQDHVSLKLSWGELICFYGSRGLFERLSALWTGRIVYQRHWHAFLEEMRGEWLLSAGMVSQFH